MKITFLLTLLLFSLIQSSESCGKNTMRNSGNQNNSTPPATREKVKFDRLPENIKMETEVRKTIKNDKGETVSFEITTVEKRLNELEAGYKNDRLVDKSGKEIRFFNPLCRGVSRGTEGDKNDQKEKDEELAELEKNYTVIVLYCDPRKAM